MFDVIIVGGGPAGLSAALILGRSRRKVLLCDTGRQRNIRSSAMHGYLTRDGMSPYEFLNISQKELMEYNVTIEQREISKIKFRDDKFEAAGTDGNKIYSKRILIATGIVDNIPQIPGMDELYGKSVHHCPYCDGWEVRDKKLAVYGRGKEAYTLAFSLKTWSIDVIILSDGKTNMRKIDKEKLAEGEIQIVTKSVEKLEGEEGQLKKIFFKDGNSIERDALFFTTGARQCSTLAQELGCRFTKDGYIKTDKKQHTGVPGVFVAGDAAKDMKFVIVAAAEGARAGVAINHSLQEDERHERTAGLGLY